MQGPPYPPHGGAPPPGGFGAPPPAGYGAPPPGGFGGPPAYGGPPQGYPPPQGYAPAGQPGYQTPGAFAVACPRCGSTSLHMPSYTWWGGLLGPWLLKHTVCQACNFGFNRKTGKENSIGMILLYTVGVVFLVTLLFGGCGAATYLFGH